MKTLTIANGTGSAHEQSRACDEVTPPLSDVDMPEMRGERRG